MHHRIRRVIGTRSLEQRIPMWLIQRFVLRGVQPQYALEMTEDIFPGVQP
jgi:hypothetical protein